MSASDDCRIEIANINEQLSKLEKAQKVKQIDPKNEKQIQYFKDQKEKHSKLTQEKIKDVNKQIATITESLEDKRDKELSKLDRMLQEFTEKIERQKQEAKDKCEQLIEKKAEKLEDEKKKLEDTEQTYEKYCMDNIIQREEVVEDKVYEFKKNELLKEREYQIKRLNEFEQYEKELNSSFRQIAQKKRYFYQGRVFYSEAEREDAIKLDRDIMKKRVLEAEDDEEDENSSYEDLESYKNLDIVV